MAIKPVDIEALSDRAGNIHEAIVATAKRARQINEEIKIEFNQRIELFAPKTTETAESEETDINPDQLNVSLEFEKRPKPTDVALDELIDGKLAWQYKEKEEPPAVRDESSAEEDEGEEE